MKTLTQYINGIDELINDAQGTAKNWNGDKARLSDNVIDKAMALKMALEHLRDS